MVSILKLVNSVIRAITVGLETEFLILLIRLNIVLFENGELKNLILFALFLWNCLLMGFIIRGLVMGLKGWIKKLEE